MCVCVFSDPFPNICHPVIDIRSLIPLNTMCLVQRGLFSAAYTETPEFSRQQLTEGQRHRIPSPFQILADTPRHT